MKRIIGIAMYVIPATLVVALVIYSCGWRDVIDWVGSFSAVIAGIFAVTAWFMVADALIKSGKDGGE